MQRTYQLFTLFICSLGLLFFTSAAVAPASIVEEVPPVERTTLSKKELRKQLRQEARVARLETRLERATSDRRKLRLQKRIDNAQQQNDDIAILSIVALVFAFIFPIVGLILAIIARNKGGGLIADLAFWISLIFLILILIGIIFYGAGGFGPRI